MQTIEYEGYHIQTVQQGSLSRIVKPKGGKIKDSLEGLWTSPAKAKIAIDSANRLPPIKKAGKQK